MGKDLIKPFTINFGLPNEYFKRQNSRACTMRHFIPHYLCYYCGGRRLLDPSYSHIGKTVSELVERGAPNRDLLNIMLGAYNILIIPFAIGLLWAKERMDSKPGHDSFGPDGHFGCRCYSFLPLRCRWSIGDFYGNVTSSGGWLSSTLHICVHVGLLA